MSYYFVKDATTQYGPWHVAVAVEPGKTISATVANIARERGIIVCQDWTAEPIDEPEYVRLTT